VWHGGYIYHIGLCGELTQAGCDGSFLCRLRENANTAAADVHKYTFNKMVLESGHMKLVYNLVSPPPACHGN